jgi:RNA polymerase sigma-70 factor (ECF subfamily)
MGGRGVGLEGRAMEDASDLRDLAGRLKAREAAAWEELYRLTHLPLLRTLRRLLQDEGRAEEALQASYLTAIERIAAFDPARGTADAWLAGIARMKAREARREPRAAPLEEAEEEAAAGPAPGGWGLNGGGSEAEVVALALDRLEPRYAEVLRRKYLEEESLEAIAGALRLKPATVGTLLHRGRERFREAYRRLCERMEKPHGKA